MNQKSWELKNTKQVTEELCCNCQTPITIHLHYDDLRFCEECRNEITASYNAKLKDPEEQEHINRYINCEDFLESVYEELSYVPRGIDERF